MNADKYLDISIMVSSTGWLKIEYQNQIVSYEVGTILPI